MWRGSARSLGLACLILALPAFDALAVADAFCGALGHEPCPKNECGALSALKSFFGVANDCNVKIDPCSPGLEVHEGKCMMHASPAAPALPPASGSVTKYEVTLIDAGLDSKPLRHELSYLFVRDGRKLYDASGDKPIKPADQYPIVLRLLPAPPSPPDGEETPEDNSSQTLSINVYLQNRHILLGAKTPTSSQNPASLIIKRDLNPALFTYRLDVMNSEDDSSFGMPRAMTSKVWDAMNRSAEFFDKYIPAGKKNKKIDIVFDDDNEAPSYRTRYFNFTDVPLISMGKNPIQSNLSFNVISHEYGHKVMGDLYGDFIYSYSRPTAGQDTFLIGESTRIALLLRAGPIFTRFPWLTIPYSDTPAFHSIIRKIKTG